MGETDNFNLCPMDQGKGVKILCVSSDPEAQNFFSATLEEAGFSVITATSGEQALAILETGAVKLVILGLCIPDTGGVGILRRIKSNPKTENVFVVLALDQSDPALDHTDRLEAGADGYLIKPFTARLLVLRINEFLRYKNTLDDLRESEQRFRSVITNSEMGYFFIDREGFIRDVNDAWIRLYKYSSREEILNHHFEEIQRFEDRDAAREVVEGIMNGEPRFLKGEFTRQCKDGSTGYHAFSARAVRRGDEVIGIEGFILDHTQQKLTEQVNQRVMEDLEKSNNLFRQLFNSMSEGFTLHEVLYDEVGNPVDYRILDTNPVFEKHVGIPVEKALSKRASEVYGILPPPYLDIYETVARTGKPCRFSSFVPDLDRYFDISVFSHQKGYFTTVFTDSTESKRVENELISTIFMLKSVLDTTADGLLVVDLDKNVISSNSQFTDMWQIPYELLSRKEGLALLSHVQSQLSDPTAFMNKVKWLFDQPEEEAFDEVRFLDGKIFEWYSKPHRIEGKTAGRVLSFRDVTEKRQAFETIRNHNRDLVQKVRERTAVLEATNRELEAFSYSVSHDLRAPLRAVIGYSSILKEKYLERLDEEGLHCLDSICKNGNMMASLIDGLLSFSRMNRNEMIHENIDMGSIVGSIIGEIRIDRRYAGIRFVENPMPPATGDSVMLRQVWQNLLLNAAKFSLPKPSPVIETGHQIREGKKVYYVKDNGVGFDMKYYNKLFGVFERLHSPREFEGNGIGLALVKRIIERQQGKVWAESTTGEGAVFYFTVGEEK